MHALTRIESNHISRGELKTHVGASTEEHTPSYPRFHPGILSSLHPSYPRFAEACVPFFRHDMQVKVNNEHFVVKECPFCHPIKASFIMTSRIRLTVVKGC